MRTNGVAHRRKQVLRGATIVAALVALTSCIPVFGTPSGPINAGVVTPDGTDTYSFATSGLSVFITAQVRTRR